MKVIGWRKGKERVLVTDDPKKLEAFSELMDRTEYIFEQTEGEK